MDHIYYTTRSGMRRGTRRAFDKANDDARLSADTCRRIAGVIKIAREDL